MTTPHEHRVISSHALKGFVAAERPWRVVGATDYA
jgi:hypothetical protein